MEVFDFVFGKLWGFVYNTYFLNWQAISISFAMAVAMALVVMAVEMRYVGYEKSGFRRVLFDRSKSTITDIVYFALHTTGLITLFSVLVSLGIPHFVASILKNTVQLDLGASLPSWAHLVLYLILADFMAYWQHRLMHRIPTLWKVHEFHHSAEEFNTLTVFREHPIDKALNFLAMAVPAVILGIPTAEFTVFVTIYGIIGYVKHSNIPWHGWVGKWVIQSPVDHHIHHSKVREHHDTNFANNFAIWDHIFGTYYHGTNRNSVLGLDVPYFNKDGVVADTVGTQMRFLSSLVALVPWWKRTKSVTADQRQD